MTRRQLQRNLERGLRPFIEILGLPPDHEKVQAFVRDKFLEKEISEGVSYYGNCELGIGMRHEDVLDTVFLYGNNEEGFRKFSDPILPGLTVESSKPVVRQMFGMPQFTESAKFQEALEGKTWDKYSFDTFHLHFTYNPDQSIERVTLMSPEDESEDP